MATGRTVCGPKVPTLKGTEHQHFLYLVSSLKKSLFFILHGWIPSGRPLKNIKKWKQLWNLITGRGWKNLSYLTEKAQIALKR